MARPKREEDSVLRMALVGYELEQKRITDEIAKIQGLLNGATPDATTGDVAKPVKKKRRMSAAARKRIGAATAARWAARRKTNAGKG